MVLTSFGVAEDSDGTCLVTSSDADDHLDGILREVAAVSSNDESGTLGSRGDGIERGLDEVLGVVLLLEDLDTLAETTSAWTLAVERPCGNGLDGCHQRSEDKRERRREEARRGEVSLCVCGWVLEGDEEQEREECKKKEESKDI